MAKKGDKMTPAIQAVKGAGSGGNVPPPEHRWKPGQSGNPKGRPPAGLAVREWLNQMQGWSLAEIKDVLTDDDAPVNKVAAARTWIDACSQDRTSGGAPIAGSELDRICDRTSGKPSQKLEHTGEDGGPVKIENAHSIKTDLKECSRRFEEFSRRQAGAGPVPPDRN